MEEWRPNQDGLQQLVLMLSQTNSASQEVQAEIYKKLDEFHKIHDFNNYLMYIFAHLEPTPTNTEIRMTAGILLKNNLNQNYGQLDTIVKKFIQQKVLSCLGDEYEMIRKTAGSIIAATIRVGGLPEWPNLMESLVGALNNPNTDARYIDGILCALSMVTEDSAYHMCQSDGQGGPERYAEVLNTLIPLLLRYMGHEVPQFRYYALVALSHFIVSFPRALIATIQDYIIALFKLGGDPNPKTRKLVCTSFLLLASVAGEYIETHFPTLIPMMLQLVKDSDEDVALEACEFWNVVCDRSVSRSSLRPYLSQLVPVLLDGMIYSEEDQLRLRTEEQDTNVADQSQDIAPIHYNARNDEEDDDDIDDEEDLSGWNLRNCSASSLDYLSEMYNSELLNTLFPLLEQRMQNQTNWAITESVILALGAVAKGCYDGIKEILPRIIPFFLQNLQHPEVLVRNSACWGISRYSTWITQQDHKVYLEPMLVHLLNNMRHRSKSVQRASCLAVTRLQEKTRINLSPYFEPMVTAIVEALKIYQSINLYTLYDCIGIFATATVKYCTDEQKNQFASLVTPTLINHWRNLNDDDKGLCNLTECFMDIFYACGPLLKQAVVDIYNRCLRIIDTTLVSFASENGTARDSDMIMAPIDLISVLVEQFGSDMKELIAPSNLLGLLFRCMKENSRIRKETFALLGDICSFSMDSIVGVFNVLIPEILLSIAPHQGRATANACWAISEMIRYSNDQVIAPYAVKILQALVEVFKTSGDRFARKPIENASVALGWLAHRAPQIVAESLSNFFSDWVYGLTDIYEGTHKLFASLGFCKVLELNPQAISDEVKLKQFFIFVGVWEKPNEELGTKFNQLLQGYKSSLQQQLWNNVLGKIENPYRDNLRIKYNI